MTASLRIDDPVPGVDGTTGWAPPRHRNDPLAPTPDLLVVGGGVAGLAVAAAAVAAGMEHVQVVDRGPLAGGATGRNAGALIPDVHALAVGPDEAALGRRGLARHRALAARLGYPLRDLTWLQVTPERPMDDRLVASGARWLASEAEVATVSDGQVRASAGVLVPGQAATEPVALARAVAATVPHVTTGVRVDRVHARRALRVDTSAGPVHPGAVVLATGRIPRRWWPTTRRWVTGHLARTAPVPGLSRDLAVARDVVVVPQGDGGLLVGGTRDGQRPGGAVDPDVVERIRTCAAEVVPAVAEVAFEHVWTGQRPVVDDDLPVVDEVAPDVLVVGGLYHTGVLTGPGAGRRDRRPTP